MTEAERVARIVYDLCIAPAGPWLGRESREYEWVRNELERDVTKALSDEEKRGS